MTTVECLSRECDWGFTGAPDKAEREARRHGGELAGGPKPGHPTLTSEGAQKPADSVQGNGTGAVICGKLRVTEKVGGRLAPASDSRPPNRTPIDNTDRRGFPHHASD